MKPAMRMIVAGRGKAIRPDPSHLEPPLEKVPDYISNMSTDKDRQVAGGILSNAHSEGQGTGCV
ncbi:hypothetical protein YTPLAS18_06690 [Nitrospira sp.]|nr:hypothetical protein YTPLAS18_06690 [Nitrospira sp.]